MEILDALLLLEEQAINNCIDESHYGICYNLSELTGELDESYDFVRENCEDWEHFSGNSVYPIEGCSGEPLWEGKQLELRLSLLDHLIAKAKLLQV